MFRLEAVRAKHGDALLLHHGTSAPPRTMLIDGGPAGVYRRFLKKALRAVADERGVVGPLPLEAVIVSHIDHDHVKGIIDFFNDLREARDDNRTPIAQVEMLWHNSFSDAVGGRTRPAEIESQAARVADVAEANPRLPLGSDQKLTLQSVKEGRRLRTQAEGLAVDLNPGFQEGLITDSAAIRDFEDITVQILGPSHTEIEALRKKWDKEVAKLLSAERRKRAEAAAYLDTSVANLSSVVMLVEQGQKSMLLTGDARGDTILSAIENNTDRLANGSMKVDLLKLPHHGSDRNVEVDFFRKIRADHYVVSGDGRHGNPEPETLEMIFEARDDDEPFAVHLTYAPDEMIDDYPIDDLEEVFAQARDRGRDFRVNQPDDDAISLVVDL